jgi:hypothetical protein
MKASVKKVFKQLNCSPVSSFPCSMIIIFCSKPFYLSMALQLFVRPWPLFSFLIVYTQGWTPWTGDQPVAGRLPIYRINVHRHQLLEWDSNPWAKAVHALDRTVTVSGAKPLSMQKYIMNTPTCRRKQ